jgi:uncharacterized membrane-anchored protein YhcB (DUF1043 family)
MGWVPVVVTSEFVWGTIIGILLSVVAARLAIRFQSAQQTRVVGTFSLDLVSNVQDYIRVLEDHRERNKVIHYDFLALVEAEVAVWGRNREHMVLIKDGPTRRQLRDFFTETATHITKIRHQLNEFEQHQNRAVALTDPNLSAPHSEKANARLAEAHRLCDRLADFALKQDRLKADLQVVAEGRSPLLSLQR